ncbi:hypothetical protein V8G69_13380 [Gaetbulibacter sp. M235]|uniref:hypothetical protein n=1 Tax=Gaetbulibacter sp. M235 TaxID=3126510 RepID=UPI00374E67C5
MNNHQNIKVSEALKKGNKWLVMPSISLMLFFFLVTPAALMYFFRDDKNSILFIVLSISSFVLGVIVPISWWSINVVKYKIWAGNNVKDIHRFYREAQIKNLIDERPFFRKIEIKTEKQKKELLRFYKRLNSEKVLVRDINNAILRETIFKSTLKWNILIYLILMIGLFYMCLAGKYNLKNSLILASVFLVLIGLDLYKIYKYKFILKINDTLISYKDDKILVYWKDIVSYFTIPGIQYNPSKLIINTVDGTHELLLENYGKIKLDKVLDVLNENKHRFDINESVR